MSEEEINSNGPIPETTTETNSQDNNKGDNKAQVKESNSSKDLNLFSEESVEGFKKIVSFYSENVRLPGAYELKRIKYLHDEFKAPELIILALQQAIESNARNLRYVETVLYNWRDKGIKTLEEAEKFIKSYKKYKGDGEDGRFKGIHGENRCHNSKDSSKDSAKWSGYKPPEPKRRADTDDSGLI